ncbi:hypothetical protein EB796_010251 [Bugula neritina]|uniref:Uncharacterized protein n=1 Tax=Bugula neritina TaxID=10212 RepID=A0A7J7JYJ3_BUGNE|nr:hypothetical protein EB796_010251 [Bugula neritina]
MQFIFKQIQNLSSCLFLKKSSGERAMLIKTAHGDRAVLYGHWANMKKGFQVIKEALFQLVSTPMVN